MASSFYNANPLLKSVGVNVQYTPEQLDEYVKCAQDPIHFINTHIKIISLDKGLILFKLFDYQEKFIRAIHENRFVISLMPRQSGKTTVVAAYLTWFMLFNANKTVAILANKSAAAREVMSRIQLMIENLPMWLQQGVTEWNKGSIAFENNSKGFTAATSSSGIRGKSCVTGDTKVCVEIDSQFFYIDIELLLNNCTTTNYQPSEALKYTVYKTTNTLNGKIYAGFHSCPASGILRKEYGALSCFKDGYLGSGKLMRAALKKYAPDIFGQEILGVFDSKVDAEKLEAEIVNSEFVLREDNYNIVTGGNVTIMRGADNGFFGKKHSRESLDKIQATRKENGLPTYQFTITDNVTKVDYKGYGEALAALGYLELVKDNNKISRRRFMHQQVFEGRLTINNSEFQALAIDAHHKRLEMVARQPEISAQRAAQCSARFLGTKRKEESKIQSGLSVKKWIAEHHEEHKARMDKINKNPEKIRKMAEKHRGMRRSQETKNNISTAAKLRRDMGEVPPNKGKVAIWHQETNTVRYVDKDAAIPGGWVRGRGSKRAAK